MLVYFDNSIYNYADDMQSYITLSRNLILKNVHHSGWNQKKFEFLEVADFLEEKFLAIAIS